MVVERKASCGGSFRETIGQTLNRFREVDQSQGKAMTRVKRTRVLYIVVKERPNAINGLITHVPVFPEREPEEWSISREVPKSDSMARGLGVNQRLSHHQCSVSQILA
jgi:hypothetical protein